LDVETNALADTTGDAAVDGPERILEHAA
jgi:hypothetical protein